MVSDDLAFTYLQDDVQDLFYPTEKVLFNEDGSTSQKSPVQNYLGMGCTTDFNTELKLDPRYKDIGKAAEFTISEYDIQENSGALELLTNQRFSAYYIKNLSYKQQMQNKFF